LDAFESLRQVTFFSEIHLLVLFSVIILGGFTLLQDIVEL